MLLIQYHEFLRTTLPVRSGNEGWIGVSPSGSEYHVVVPVDAQIARGVMACNRPTDGTPFGGYRGWSYFRCPPFETEDDGADESTARMTVALETARTLILLLRERGVEAELVGLPDGETKRNGAMPVSSTPPARSSDSFRCTCCGRAWERLGAFLKDPEVRIHRYRPCLEDFRKGVYIFSHRCGGKVDVPVVRLARPRVPGRSLAGTHACPGFCSYETSLTPCMAVCEGSLYRRVAGKLRKS